MTIALVCFFCALFMFYVTEQREKNKMRGMFSRMVSPEVLSYMDQDPDKFALTGVNREATMFFSDVAGFTTISENLTPEQLVGLLNDYLTPMSDIVVETHGYLDKYEGDAIMAVWGVPYPDDEHAIQGCKAAILQQKKLDEIRPLLKEKYGVELTARMGINSGEVSAGNMGSEQKMQYTVMGDPVNQAARYEPLNKMYDTDIIIGQSTFEQAEKHINARLLDKMVVKGKTIPIKVYELLAFEEEISTDKQFAVDQYEKALALHWERKFDEALAILQETFDREILDIPSQRLYERIKGFKEHPPVEGWQGEVFRTSKD